MKGMHRPLQWIQLSYHLLVIILFVIIIMSKQLIQELINNFKDAKTGKINIEKIRQYVNNSQEIRSKCKIFVKKLDRIGLDVNEMRQSQFQQYFSPNVTNKQHFDLIFQAIDSNSSNFLSRSQIQQLNKKYDINLSHQDISMMIEHLASDGQKIKKEDIYKFIK